MITLPSMILGWIIARYLIAEFLYRIGITYYTIEATGVIPFTPHFFLSALCVAAVTCGGALLSCRRSLKLTPAALMRPKPPAQGHRIFLERITPYWRRLNFKDTKGNEIPLPEEGTLITPRMAKALAVDVGDTLNAESLDGTVMALKVADIVDFPVGNEIYLSKTAFAKVSALPFLVRTLLIQGQDLDLSKLNGDPRISLVETKEEMRNNMLIVLESLQSFQMILILFAGLLAFAVMMVLGASFSTRPQRRTWKFCPRLIFPALLWGLLSCWALPCL